MYKYPPYIPYIIYIFYVHMTNHFIKFLNIHHIIYINIYSPWEFDMDLDFIMDLKLKDSSKTKLKGKCLELLHRVRMLAPSNGFHVFDITCGDDAKIDFKKKL